MTALLGHHIRARDAIIAAAKGMWSRDAFKWQASTPYLAGKLVIDSSVNGPGEWHLYRLLANTAGSPTFVPAEWTDLGVAGDGVEIASHGGNFTVEDIGKISKRAPAMLFSVLAYRTDLQKSISRTRFACWIICENRRSPNRWDCAAILASQVESWLAKRSCRFGDEADSPVMSTAQDIEAASVYSAKMETKGFGLWMVSWWQEIDVDFLASENECLAFGPDAGIGPDGPVDLGDFDTAMFYIIPPDSEDIGTDPNFPDNERETSAEVDLT